jgi:hypothetical protein
VKTYRKNDRDTQLNRVPIEDICRAIELVKRWLQGWHAMLGDGRGGPALAPVNRTQRSRLPHEEDFVHAHRKNLPGNVLGGISKQERSERSDLFRAHLLDSRNALLLGLRFGRYRSDEAAPRER